MNNRQKGILAEVGKKLEETIASSERNIVYMEAVLDNLEPGLREELTGLAEETTDWRVILEKSSIELLKGLEKAMLSAQQISEDKAK